MGKARIVIAVQHRSQTTSLLIIARRPRRRNPQSRVRKFVWRKCGFLSQLGTSAAEACVEGSGGIAALEALRYTYIALEGGGEDNLLRDICARPNFFFFRPFGACSLFSPPYPCLTAWAVLLRSFGACVARIGGLRDWAGAVCCLVGCSACLKLCGGTASGFGTGLGSVVASAGRTLAPLVGRTNASAPTLARWASPSLLLRWLWRLVRGPVLRRRGGGFLLSTSLLRRSVGLLPGRRVWQLRPAFPNSAGLLD